MKTVQCAILAGLESHYVETRRGAKHIRMVGNMFPSPVGGGGSIPGAFLYLEVDKNALIEHRIYQFFPSGSPIPDHAQAIDSLLVGQGGQAMHLYWLVGEKVPQQFIDELTRQRAEHDKRINAGLN